MKKEQNEKNEKPETTETPTTEGSVASDMKRLLELETKAGERDKFFALAQQTYAELENYRKRTTTQIEEASRYGATKLILKILEALDALERALKPENRKDPEAAIKGVEQAQRLFLAVLEQQGLKRIPAINTAFDPEFHEAVLATPTEDEAQNNQVLEEYRAGYQLHDRVIRASQVRVGKKS